ncbi:hypothetical protein SNEBB_001483 [Seison nebaliae]|nr:hypothetical protein SNEBB_001483 [Seison nebaliae]
MIRKINIVFLLVSFYTCLVQGEHSKVLEDYVLKKDPNFGWSLERKYTLPGRDIYILNITSQKWLNDSFISPTLWIHYAYVAVPHKIKVKDTALIYMEHRIKTPGIPSIDDAGVAEISEFALMNGMIGVDLKNVPISNVIFKDDPSKKVRFEDEILGYCWRKFLETRDTNVLGRLPMVKSLVNTMTALQEFARDHLRYNICNYIPTGQSKRGWTSMLAAAVDPRITHIIPIVYNMIDMKNVMTTMYKSIGGVVNGLAEYKMENVTGYAMDKELATIIDPFYYNEKYKDKSILFVTASNDRFFFPDNEPIFWNDLNGNKFLSRIPNCDHFIEGHKLRLWDVIGAFVSRISQKNLPSISWEMKRNGSEECLEVIANDESPIMVEAFLAHSHSNKARDFRALIPNDDHSGTIRSNIFWKSVDFEYPEFNKFRKCIKTTPDYYQGLYFDLYFPTKTRNGHDRSLILSTHLMVTPDTYPFESCNYENCGSKLM